MGLIFDEERYDANLVLEHVDQVGPSDANEQSIDLMCL